MEMMLEYFYNYIQAVKDAQGFTVFSRFYPEQLDEYSKDSMYYAMSNSGAGVVLGFITTGNSVQFKCKTTSKLAKFLPIVRQLSISSVIYAMQCLKKKKNKLKKILLDGIDFTVDGRLIATKQPKRGKIRFRFDNPLKKKCEVKIYFPIIFEMELKSLKISGTVEKLPPKEKILCLGDSITQGFFAGYPSQNYVSLIARKLNVDALNQGVGGYMYRRESLKGLEKLPPPKFITVAYGTNDWYLNPDINAIQKNIAGYYKHLTSIFPSTPVYVITPIWRGDFVSPSGVPLERIAQIIREETAPYTAVTVIDGMKLVPHDNAYFSDGYLHPSAEGFTIFADTLAGFLPAP